MKLHPLIFAASLISALLAPLGFSQNALVPLPADLNGELNGAPYRIRVPADWNGTLLVYAYGYAEALDPPPQAPMAPADTDAQMLLARGFALAGLRASGAVQTPGMTPLAGWNMKEKMQQTAALTAAFRDIVGQPKQTIVWGKSMGGLVALALIEKFPGLYDGAVPLCAPAAGTPRLYDQKLDITLSYAIAFNDWDPQWGTPGNISPDLNFFTEVAPHIASQLTPDKAWRWEFLRLVNRIPYDPSFYSMPSPSSPFLFQILWLAFVPRPDLNMRAGGRVDQNLGRTYSLRDEDWNVLLSEFPGINREQVNALLDQMNQNAIYASDVNARNYAEHYYEPTGRITRPVISLHTTNDAAAIPNNESAYRAAVRAMGKEDLLMQEFTTGVTNGGVTVNTHCTFYPAQYFAAIDAMVQWLDTGTRPSPSDYFTEGLGFKPPDYVPDPWPW